LTRFPNLSKKNTEGDRNKRGGESFQIVFLMTYKGPRSFQFRYPGFVPGNKKNFKTKAGQKQRADQGDGEINSLGAKEVLNALIASTA